MVEEKKEVAPKPEDKKPAAPKGEEDVQVEVDCFEEFESAVGMKVTLEDENRDLWQAEWDDEDVDEDFHVRLREELQAER
ncbi:hypothetical protein DUNSADRAFT_5884 [Dunaliella salina]|uniref:26S proteasome complex subunit SEM1 n=1 Tax=Dunaliella salina TaxID=3046 RepID=A0ABQ7GPH7_DUNSA|nr:hypothetical protein DUNSADRAFT_5884 [Dunaliella salina]|eukprot:KAF5836498.1 hypothetical protein DUNSADRAFT_5884 [Dunaliella salina]